jgi:hypothetical protein
MEADLRVVQDWRASMMDPGTGATVMAHFREEDIGLEALVELNTHELREFGVIKLGWQKTLQHLQHKARQLLTDRLALPQQLDHALPPEVPLLRPTSGRGVCHLSSIHSRPGLRGLTAAGALTVSTQMLLRQVLLMCC